MQFPVVTCLLVCLLISCSTQFSVNQYKQVSVSEGSAVMLGCFVDGQEIQDPGVQWFKQLPGTAPTFILRHGDNSSVHWADTSLDRYQPIRKSSNAQFLQIRNASSHDSALYWCLQSNGPSHLVWGDGTHLSVYGGEDVQAPSVSLMSSQESPDSSNPLHVACSVTGFYPPVIDVTWKLDGQTNLGEIIIGPFLSEQDNAYSMISILEFSSHPGKNLSSVSCEVRHDSSRTRISKALYDCFRDT